MILIEPKTWDSFYDLLGGGRVYFGRSSFGPGMRVGTPPIVAKFQGVEGYPEEFFVVTSIRSMHKINKEMNGTNVIPDWLRADCFEYFWRKINVQSR